VDAVNRRGRAFVCLVTGSPLKDESGAVAGVILEMQEALEPEDAGGG
jgi:hypothetical protein